jgi:hypothetical protein
MSRLRWTIISAPQRRSASMRLSDKCRQQLQESRDASATQYSKSGFAKLGEAHYSKVQYHNGLREIIANVV